MRISMILLLGLTVVASGCIDSSSGDSTGDLNVENIKSNAEEAPYSNLANYPDRVRGDAIRGRGRAIQSWNTTKRTAGLINTVTIEAPHRECGAGGCFVSGSELKYTRGTIYATFSSNAPENDTLVNYWGVARGTKTYENTNGRYLTVPKVEIVDYNTSNASLYVPE